MKSVSSLNSDYLNKVQPYEYFQFLTYSHYIISHHEKYFFFRGVVHNKISLIFNSLQNILCKQ